MSSNCLYIDMNESPSSGALCCRLLTIMLYTCNNAHALTVFLPLPHPLAPTSPFLSQDAPPGGDHFTATWRKRRASSERRWVVY